MHPILSDPRKLVSYLCACLLVGLLIARFISLADMAPWGTALFFALPVAVVYAYYVCRSLPISGRKFAPTIALFLVASVFSGGLWLILCLAWNNLATTLGWWTIHFTDNNKSLLFSVGCGCYLISLLFHDGVIAAERLRDAELQTTKSQIHAREAELHMLRAQINPHFLFNSLNSISALTSIDATAARAMTIALAQFFRQSLALSGMETIPLHSEIELCERFLDVEKIRFGSKLASEINVDDLSQSALVPPMLLQPLIENAIKHGIRDLTGGGVVLVTCMVRDSWLHIVVANPCQEPSLNPIGNGMGLENIKQRLQNMYGNQARCLWHKDATTFTVEITLPLKTES
jgi:sensor histidine kinase YesM